ncbi:MAG TPA: hypothetical protein VIP77_20625 [Jiangellaceae bacterium]
MLGRSELESGAQARSAARIAGWIDEDDATFGALLDLGPTTATLSTVAHMPGLAAVVHLGHPAQPSHELERALLAAPPALMITSAVAIPAEWVWVGRTAEAAAGVVVDDAAMRDCQHTLRMMGLNPQLVSTRTPIDTRIELAGAGGTLVVERTNVPPGFVELPGSAQLAEGAAIWYGLVEARDHLPDTLVSSQVWLAFGPHDDHRGSLQQTLAVIADAGIDLQHLRSHESKAGPHVFFSAFTCDDRSALEQLVREFDDREVAHRVLAVVPGQGFAPCPDGIVPMWSTREVAETAGA